MWKIKCEGGGEWWWARFRSGSGSGSGSMKNIMDPDPEKWCRSFGSGSATLLKRERKTWEMFPEENEALQMFEGKDGSWWKISKPADIGETFHYCRGEEIQKMFPRRQETLCSLLREQEALNTLLRGQEALSTCLKVRKPCGCSQEFREPCAHF